MSMLLQQIRRATYSRRATAAALTPPLTFSRFYSTNNRVLGLEKEGTVWAFLKNGSAIAFMFGTFYCVDYGGYRKRSELRQKLNKNTMKKEFTRVSILIHSKLYDEVEKQLKELREMQMTMADK